VKPPRRPSGSRRIVADDAQRAYAFIQALGGAKNLLGIDACTTRLRLTLEKNDIVNEQAPQEPRFQGVVRPGPGTLQVVLGPEADRVGRTPSARRSLKAARRPKLRKLCRTRRWQPSSGLLPARGRGRSRRVDCSVGAAEANLRQTETVAGTRLRAELIDADRVDEGRIKRLGATAVMRFSSTLVHRHPRPPIGRISQQHSPPPDPPRDVLSPLPFRGGGWHG